MNEVLKRAWWLVERRPYDAAEEEVRRYLSQQPNDGMGLSMLAWCKIGQNKWKEAEEWAQKALVQDPGLSFAYRVLAVTCYHQHKFKKAMQSLDAGQQLEPENPFHNQYRVMVYKEQEKPRKALEEIAYGLEKDPQHYKLPHLKAETLWLLGKRNLASAAIQEALRQHPNDSNNLCLQGWLALDKRKVDEASGYFIDALRENPLDQFAQDGLVECLKGKMPWYRLILRWSVFLKKQSEALISGLTMGGIVAFHSLVNRSEKVPSAYLSLVITFLCFLLIPILIVPASNLLLLRRPEAAYLFGKQEKQKAWFSFVVILSLLLGCLLSW